MSPSVYMVHLLNLVWVCTQRKGLMTPHGFSSPQPAHILSGHTVVCGRTQKIPEWVTDPDWTIIYRPCYNLMIDNMFAILSVRIWNRATRIIRDSAVLANLIISLTHSPDSLSKVAIAVPSNRRAISSYIVLCSNFRLVWLQFETSNHRAT